MSHINLTKAILASATVLITIASCNQVDPIEEANKLNNNYSELIGGVDPQEAPFQRYSKLLSIQEQGESLLQESRSLFKKKKLASFNENITKISDRQDYKDAWSAMAKDNKSKLNAFPSGTWMVNADSLTANSIFKMDKKHESILPYNIEGNISLLVNESDGLIYSGGYDSPVFFDYVDSTKRYTIMTSDGIVGSFRKAERADLSMGHYSYVYSWDANYDGAEEIDIYSGTAFFMGKSHKISFTDEKIFGYNFEEIVLADGWIFCHADKLSRNGCYDCWALIDSNLKFNFKWQRVMEDGARNFLFIFGKPNEDWEYIAYRSTASNDTSSSSESVNWDELLDSYEKYVDKYITLLKKANNGDASAMAEYVSFLEKATDLSEKLSNAEGEMSTAQMNRYLSITQKMSNAAASML